MKKIGIVTSGGGMSCSYSVGVLLALVEKYKFTNPYVVIGGSGSTGTLAYYVAKQYPQIKNIWENLLSTKKFISFARPQRIMDIDYLIDEVFKKQEPLDTKTINNSDISFFVAVTSLETGKLEYYSNKDGLDIFELLRASSAIPVAFNKPVLIKGNKYVDGDVGDSLSSNIKKAKDEGAEIVIAIDSTNKSKIINFFIKIWSLFQNKNFRKGFYIYHTKHLNNGPKTIFIKPTTTLATTTLDNDREHIVKTINIGYNDLMSNNEVRELFIS